MKFAQELQVEAWLNTTQPLSLTQLKGKAIAVYAFQMLCPGCVEHTLPQAKMVHKIFSSNDLVVIGLHTVFEHHEAMKEVSLRAFLHEYRIDFPVGIDQPGDTGSLPKTMEAYRMQGTPTLLLINREGHLHAQHFGHIPDLQLGAELAMLTLEKGKKIRQNTGSEKTKNVCNLKGTP